jgi:hypothetical protein
MHYGSNGTDRNPPSGTKEWVKPEKKDKPKEPNKSNKND